MRSGLSVKGPDGGPSPASLKSSPILYGDELLSRERTRGESRKVKSYGRKIGAGILDANGVWVVPESVECTI